MHGKALEVKRALITGASDGIGAAMAREFARHRFDLVLVARRDHKLRSLAASLADDFDVDVRWHACDLTRSGAVEALGEALDGLEIDVLVNNAGVMYRGDFSEQSPASIDNIIDLNVRSVTQLTRLFLPAMLKRDRGRVMNVTSTVGFHAGPSLAVYAASKGYILNFTEALGEELRNCGVDAIAFCPGSTDTHMVVESYGEDLRNDPVGSLLMMSPEEVAEQGYRACMEGDIIAVPGVANAILNGIGRLQPRWLHRRIQTFVNARL